MKYVTSEMIKIWGIKDTDFMGYKLDRSNASFHHLIIPNRHGGLETMENGAVLNGLTAHPYLHLIEVKDQDIFDLITSEMIDENIKRTIDIYNLKRIRELLLYFEDRHKRDENKKGQKIIKREYIERRIQL